MSDNRYQILANMRMVIDKLIRDDHLKFVESYFDMKKQDAFNDGLTNAEDLKDTDFIKIKESLDIYDRLINIGGMVKNEYENASRKQANEKNLDRGPKGYRT